MGHMSWVRVSSGVRMRSRLRSVSVGGSHLMSIALAEVEDTVSSCSSSSLLALFHRWFRASPPLPEKTPSSVFRDLFFLISSF